MFVSPITARYGYCNVCKCIYKFLMKSENKVNFAPDENRFVVLSLELLRYY